jgi:hypothetical protein
MRILLVGLAASLLLLGATGSAQADPITSLFNTGVNASGTPLPDNTIGDPHYTLTIVPGGSTTTLRVRTSASGFPIPPYNGDDSLSAWIGPNNDSALDGPVGAYTYHTTFNLTGFNPATASISGVWSTDNEGLDILINGVSTGNSIPSATSYTSFHSFSIGSGFLAGINTLDFVVNNDGGPTALRVEMTGTATPLATAVPEPHSLILLSLGAGGIWAYCRRRRQ